MTDVYYEIKYDGNKTQKISELSPLEKALVALGDFRRTRRIESFLRATNEVVEPLSEGGLDFKKLTYFYAAVKQPLDDSVERVLGACGFSIRELAKEEYEKETAMGGI